MLRARPAPRALHPGHCRAPRADRPTQSSTGITPGNRGVAPELPATASVGEPSPFTCCSRLAPATCVWKRNQWTVGAVDGSTTYVTRNVSVLNSYVNEAARALRLTALRLPAEVLKEAQSGHYGSSCTGDCSPDASEARRCRTASLLGWGRRWPSAEPSAWRWRRGAVPPAFWAQLT